MNKENGSFFEETTNRRNFLKGAGSFIESAGVVSTSMLLCELENNINQPITQSTQSDCPPGYKQQRFTIGGKVECYPDDSAPLQQPTAVPLVPPEASKGSASYSPPKNSEKFDAADFGYLSVGVLTIVGGLLLLWNRRANNSSDSDSDSDSDDSMDTLDPRKNSEINDKNFPLLGKGPPSDRHWPEGQKELGDFNPDDY